MLSLPNNKVAIRYLPDPEKIGSIFVPDMAKERADQGIVKYVGPKVTEIRPGDYVIFSGWTGTTVHIEGEHGLIIMPEDQVICKIHPTATVIPGLWLMNGAGEPFPATYEMAVELIWQHYWELPRLANVREK